MDILIILAMILLPGVVTAVAAGALYFGRDTILGYVHRPVFKRLDDLEHDLKEEMTALRENGHAYADRMNAFDQRLNNGASELQFAREQMMRQDDRIRTLELKTHP